SVPQQQNAQYPATDPWITRTDQDGLTDTAFGRSARPSTLLPQIERDPIHGSCLLGGEDRPAQRFGDEGQRTSPLGERLQAAQIALRPAPFSRPQRHTQPGCFFLC